MYNMLRELSWVQWTNDNDTHVGPRVLVTIRIGDRHHVYGVLSQQLRDDSSSFHQLQYIAVLPHISNTVQAATHRVAVWSRSVALLYL